MKTLEQAATRLVMACQRLPYWLKLRTRYHMPRENPEYFGDGGHGHGGFLFPRGHDSFCVFTNCRPRHGDLFRSERQSGKMAIFVVHSVRSPGDPGDQHFADLSFLRYECEDPSPEIARQLRLFGGQA